MLRPQDDLILKIFTKIIEIIAVTRNPDNQITVKLGVPLCFPERFSIHNIELDMMAVQRKITVDQCSKTIIALFILKELRCKLLVKKGASRTQVINF